ncbi:hypothetical protein [Flavobacterium sp. J27]|uniref:hypothetical protein n=1 Tax=Flavobacterium sp. J27 TaxID=2060419 RepID=UPI001031B9A2|nr:hypothetical protein [Flavobacterium sp. J27]
MKKIIIVTFLFLNACLLCSCKEQNETQNIPNQTISGELFFKRISTFPSTGIPKREFAKMKFVYQKLKEEDSTKVNERFLYLEKLNQYDLLEKPSLQLKRQKDTLRIFLSEEAYKKIKSYTLNDLRQRNKKVEIELKAQEFEKNILFSNQITKIKEVDGKTPWQL